jgi:hypothetical protein
MAVENLQKKITSFVLYNFLFICSPKEKNVSISLKILAKKPTTNDKENGF